MTTYTLPSGLGSITDEVSGGYSEELTIPNTAQKRNQAYKEAMRELLKMKIELEMRHNLSYARVASGSGE